MGTELNLDVSEFIVLDMLVTKENEPVTFEQLYKAVWGAGNDPVSPVIARGRLEKLITKVNEAGEGFMLIERNEGSGYVFRTHWGQEWQRAPEKTDVPSVAAKKRFSLPGKTYYKIIAAVIAGAAVIGVAAGILIPAFLDVPAPDSYLFDSRPVPLAYPSFDLGEVVYPDIADAIAVDGREAAVVLSNPEANAYQMVFEIAFADTREIIYISGRTEPGDLINGVTLLRTLAPGEYNAVLYIRAYQPGGYDEVDNLRKEITITAR